MDGPAPLAKLITQRNRRTSQSKRETRRGSKGLSTLGLTPGTELMSELEDSLTYYISQRLQTGWQDVQFELSGATVAGEGEVKIFERIIHRQCSNEFLDENAVIGSDSDLFLMALLHKPANLWVLPETEPRTLRTSKRMRLTGFSTKALDQTWSQLRQLKACNRIEVKLQQLEARKADLAAIAILANGNDYLPGILRTSLETHAGGRGLWDTYLDLKQSPEWTDRALVLMDQASPKLDREVLAALMKKHAAQNHLVGSPERDAWTLRKPPADPCAYLEGVEWVLEMYRNGRCPDFRFMYDAQTPAVAELVGFLGSKGAAVPAAASGAIAQPQNSQTSSGVLASRLAPTPAVCALALLPPGRGSEYISPALRTLMRPGSPIADLYEVCTDCANIVEAIKSITAKLTQALQQASELDAQANAKSTDLAAAATKNVQSCRAKLRQLEEKRLQHVLAAHPYEKFPINRIETAVAEIPKDQFLGADQKLLHFGRSATFWKKQETEQCCCAACRTQQGEEHCRFSFELPRVPGPGLRTVDASGLKRSFITDLSGSNTSGESKCASCGLPSPRCRCPRCKALKDGQGAEQPPAQGHTGNSRRPARDVARESANGQSGALDGWPAVLRRPFLPQSTSQAVAGRAGLCTLLRKPQQCQASCSTVCRPPGGPLPWLVTPGSLAGDSGFGVVASRAPRLAYSVRSASRGWSLPLPGRQLMQLSRHAFCAVRHLRI